MYLLLNIFFSYVSYNLIIRLTSCLYDYNLDLGDYSSIYTLLFSFVLSLIYTDYIYDFKHEYPKIPVSLLFIKISFILTGISFIIVFIIVYSLLFTSPIYCSDGSEDGQPPLSFHKKIVDMHKNRNKLVPIQSNSNEQFDNSEVDSSKSNLEKGLTVKTLNYIEFMELYKKSPVVLDKNEYYNKNILDVYLNSHYDRVPVENNKISEFYLSQCEYTGNKKNLNPLIVGSFNNSLQHGILTPFTPIPNLYPNLDENVYDNLDGYESDATIKPKIKVEYNISSTVKKYLVSFLGDKVKFENPSNSDNINYLTSERISMFNLKQDFQTKDFWTNYANLLNLKIKGKINTLDFKACILDLAYIASKQHIENLNYTELLNALYDNDCFPSIFFDKPIYMNGKFSTYLTELNVLPLFNKTQDIFNTQGLFYTLDSNFRYRGIDSIMNYFENSIFIPYESLTKALIFKGSLLGNFNNSHKELLNKLTYLLDLKFYYFEWVNFKGVAYHSYIEANSLNQVYDLYLHERGKFTDKFFELFYLEPLYSQNSLIPGSLRFITQDDVTISINPYSKKNIFSLNIEKVKDIIERMSDISLTRECLNQKLGLNDFKNYKECREDLISLVTHYEFLKKLERAIKIEDALNLIQTNEGFLENKWLNDLNDEFGYQHFTSVPDSIDFSIHNTLLDKEFNTIQVNIEYSFFKKDKD